MSIRTVFTAAAAAVAFAAPGLAQTPHEDLRGALPDLSGAWTGELTYRDYRSDRMVGIPHERTVRVAPGGAYVASDLVFTDPGYQVFAGEIATFDGATVRMAYAGSGELTVTEARITGFQRTADGWTAAMEGEGMDAGAPASLRYVWRLEDGALSIEKQVRPDGEADYAFRNAVRLTRRQEG